MIELYRIGEVVDIQTAEQALEWAFKKHGMFAPIETYIREIWSAHNSINRGSPRKEAAESLQSIFKRLGYENQNH